MNVEELVEAAKCRTGKSDGTTKRGAYWLACPPIVLRCCGGDGIGNNGADVTFELLLRHYRDGRVQATICRHSWHQNSGTERVYESCADLLECESVESVIVTLKGQRFSNQWADYSESVYSDYNEDKVTEALAALGLPVAEPAPDEAEL